MNNPFLISGATLSAVAALFRVGCIILGSSWYRFFGAGERMAQPAAAGSTRPTLITSGIVLVLATWSFYAFSGAGVAPHLPLVRTVLCIVTGIYLLRGVAGVFVAIRSGATLWWWSSAICLTIGLIHLIGTRQSWPYLSGGMT